MTKPGEREQSTTTAARPTFRGCGYRLGLFRCPPGDPRWAEENWIGAEAHVVYPGTPVWIRPAGADPLLATANEVLLYQPGAYYRRRLAAPAGDRCLFVAVDAELAERLRITRSAGAVRHRRLDAPMHAVQYLLSQAIERADADALLIDEMVTVLLSTSAPLFGRVDPTPPMPNAVVDDVKILLLNGLTESFTLAQIPAAVHYSPFHLARMFRAHTGLTISGYRRQLRLRQSLSLVSDPRIRVLDVALAAGFDSHSHYTRCFRAAFGLTPAQARAGADAPTLRRLRSLSTQPLTT